MLYNNGAFMKKERADNDKDFYKKFLTEESVEIISRIKKDLRQLKVIALVDKELSPYELKHFTTNFLKSLVE